MSTTVSATEAKVRLGTFLERASRRGEEVIIESRGRPQAVLISVAEYEELRLLREAERRRKALERLDALADELAARNNDLSEADADQLAGRAVRDAVTTLENKGAVRFRGR